MMSVMDESFDSAWGEAWTAAQCVGILDLPGVSLTLASLGEESAGFALLRVIADEAELLLLAVRPALRRRGVGMALLDDARMRARKAGAHRMHLEVRQGNDAIDLYRIAGFDQTGRRSAYYRGKDGQLFDALSLSITLLA